jgi:GDP-4-dehydro-6-deoxy-D-mannose reductase
MQPRALITGAQGFVGRHLRRELQGRWDVTGLDRRGGGDAGDLVCDVTDGSALSRVIEEISPAVIFHLAAATPVSTGAALDMYRVNTLGTFNLLEAARQFAPEAVVIVVTSSAMYGHASLHGAVLAEDSRLLPVSAYGVSKAAQHLLGYQYAVQYDLRVVRACPFNLLGPGLPRGLVAADFAYQLAAIEAGRQAPVIVVGSLHTSRDFLDVRDACVAYRLLALHGKPGESYHVSSGRAVSIQDLLDMLIDQSGLSVTVEQRAETPERSGIESQVGDNTKLREIGWEPVISLEQSLADTLAYWRGQV